MRATFVVEGFDLSPYLAAGLSQSDIVRVSRSVVALDGTEYRSGKNKRKLSGTLLDMPDHLFMPVSELFSSPFGRLKKVSLDYTDRDRGNRVGVIFHVSSFSASEQLVIGNITYWNAISFELEEM